MASSPDDPVDGHKPPTDTSAAPGDETLQGHADGDVVSVAVLHKGQKQLYTFHSASILADLSARVSDDLNIPEQNQKFLVSPKPGLLKPPFAPSSPNGAISLADIAVRKITLLGSTASEIASLNSAVNASQAIAQRHQNRSRATGAAKPATPSRTRDWKTVHDATTYTFLQLRPLPYLPNPERSLRFLERLRDDAGIKAAMAKHKWSVPLLTEMNPAEHTTRESRTLGLNRNAGEVIELRLRTDAYDGYRDYRTIRKTLCHELAHNVFGEHDRNFWDLCHEIEREVERGDWRSGGRALSSQEFYEPAVSDEDDAVADHGGWTGGEYVLGSGSAAATATSGSPGGGGAASTGTVSRREILARAAEERLKKQKEQREQDSQPGPSS